MRVTRDQKTVCLLYFMPNLKRFKSRYHKNADVPIDFYNKDSRFKLISWNIAEISDPQNKDKPKHYEFED